MDRPINKIFSEIMWEREKKNIKYVNNYIEDYVNKINNSDSTTGRDRDVRTYPKIKGTVENRNEPVTWEMGSDNFIIAWQ